LWFVKSLPWPLDIRGSKLSFYRNIFLSQYRKQKYLVCIGPYCVKIGSKFLQKNHFDSNFDQISDYDYGMQGLRRTKIFRLTQPNVTFQNDEQQNVSQQNFKGQM